MLDACGNASSKTLDRKAKDERAIQTQALLIVHNARMAKSPSAIVEQFQDDGFVVLEDAFSEQEINTVSREVDSVIEGETALPEQEIVYEPDSEPKRVRNAFRMHLYNDFFLQVAKNRCIVNVLTDVLGGPLRLYGSQIFAKPALVGTTVPRHQDMPYWPFEPYEMISAWIALDDSTVENGCVRHVVGSHKLGILPHAPSGVPGNSLGLVEDPRISALPERPVEVRRGSCILHHCLTVHRSEANRSPKPRRGLIYVYMSPAVRLTDSSKMQGPAEFPAIT